MVLYYYKFNSGSYWDYSGFVFAENEDDVIWRLVEHYRSDTETMENKSMKIVEVTELHDLKLFTNDFGILTF